MALTVTVDKPDYVDGVPFEVRGLGVLKNREPFTLTEDQERTFARENSATVSDALKDDESYSLSGTALVSGDVTQVLGYDPSDVSGQIVVPEPMGDQSPATSMGETEFSEPVEEVAPAPTLAPAPEFKPLTTDDTAGGDS